MDTAIEISLLIVGFSGALLAIGGDTWVKKPLPWYLRVTGRGWLAIVCLVLALVLGITRQFRGQAQIHAAEARIRDLGAALQTANGALDSTRQQLSSAAAELAAIKNQQRSQLERLGALRRQQEVDRATPFFNSARIDFVVGKKKGTVIKLFKLDCPVVGELWSYYGLLKSYEIGPVFPKLILDSTELRFTSEIPEIHKLLNQHPDSRFLNLTLAITRPTFRNTPWEGVVGGRGCTGRYLVNPG